MIYSILYSVCLLCCSLLYCVHNFPVSLTGFYPFGHRLSHSLDSHAEELHQWNGHHDCPRSHDHQQAPSSNQAYWMLHTTVVRTDFAPRKYSIQNNVQWCSIQLLTLLVTRITALAWGPLAPNLQCTPPLCVPCRPKQHLLRVDM